jgi:hypothetical protein
VHLLKYHAIGFGSELPTWQFDVAKLGMGSKKIILRWLLVVVRYLSYLALSVVVQHYFLPFSTAGGIFPMVPREKLSYLDVTW